MAFPPGGHMDYNEYVFFEQVIYMTHMRTLKVGVIDISIAVHVVQRDIVHLTTATQSVIVQSVLSRTRTHIGTNQIDAVVLTATTIICTLIDVCTV